VACERGVGMHERRVRVLRVCAAEWSSAKMDADSMVVASAVIPATVVAGRVT
jgi:hypothetical protein